MAVDTAAPVRMGKYVFALLAAQTAFGCLLIALEAAGLNAPSGLNVVGGILGAVAAANWFVSDHQRDLEKSEKRRLALWGTVFTLLLGLLVFAGLAVAMIGVSDTIIIVNTAMTDGTINATSVAIVSAVVLASGLFSYAVYYFTAGFHARGLAKNITRDREPPRL